jgi:hypothetical protein
MLLLCLMCSHVLYLPCTALYYTVLVYRDFVAPVVLKEEIGVEEQERTYARELQKHATVGGRYRSELRNIVSGGLKSFSSSVEGGDESSGGSHRESVSSGRGFERNRLPSNASFGTTKDAAMISSILQSLSPGADTAVPTLGSGKSSNDVSTTRIANDPMSSSISASLSRARK